MNAARKEGAPCAGERLAARAVADGDVKRPPPAPGGPSAVHLGPPVVNSQRIKRRTLGVGAVEGDLHLAE